jgi:hypothetical protein
MGVMQTVRFVGGMRVGRRGANATWPFAELILTDTAGSVRLRRLPRAIFGRWFPELRFDPVAVVVEPHRGAFSEGVEITSDGRSVIFWSFESEHVLDGLRQRRVPVSS